MVTFCTSCGAANPPNARYCSKCGAMLGAVDQPSAEAASSADAPLASPTVGGLEGTLNTEKVQTISRSHTKKRRWFLPAAVVGGALVVGALYFWLFILDDLGSTPGQKTTPGTTVGATLEPKQLFAMTEANIRDRATTVGSQILGKLPRGSAVTGVVKLGMDGSSEWLELSDGKGFIAVINLAEFQPPEITKPLNDRVWTADGALDIWLQPDTASGLLERVSTGTRLTLAGLTSNDFIEVKLGKGGVGYLADGAAILARLGGKPVAIRFNPQTCSFGGDIDAEFAKIAARLRAQWADLENKEFVDEEARDKAYAAAEGKSTYVKLQRSFEGLTLTAIGQHYEAQSLYFSDPAAKVIETFRSKGYRVGADGTFSSTELYAGISATRGEGAAYGKSELGCGV